MRIELDPAAHHLRELTGNRQAEPAAGGPRPVQAVETLEDLLLGLAGDLRAVVRDRQRRPAAVHRRRNPHRRARRRVHEGVLQQDPPDLEHPLGISFRGDDLRRHFDRVVAGAAPELGCHLLRELRQLDRFARNGQAARIQARQIEQVGRKLRQPRDLLAHLAEELLARRLVQVGIVHQFEEAAE